MQRTARNRLLNKEVDVNQESTASSYSLELQNRINSLQSSIESLQKDKSALEKQVIMLGKTPSKHF